MSTHLNARKTITYVTGSLLIIGGLNWLVTALNKNRKDIFDYVLPGDKNAKLRSGVQKILLNWLIPAPNFLASSFFPQPLVQSAGSVVPANADWQIRVQSSPGAIVTYGPSDPNNTSNGEPWQKAYGDYAISGVVRADENGVASLVLRKPGQYTMREIGSYSPPLHVHYLQYPPNDAKYIGVWSDVKTVFVDDR